MKQMSSMQCVARVLCCVIVGASARSLRSGVRALDQLPFNNASELENVVVHMVKSQAGGSGLDELVQTIKVEVDKMLAKVESAANTAQQGLDALHSAFGQCSSTHGGVVDTSPRDTARTEHKSCRVEEGNLATQNSSCEADVPSKKTTMEQACNLYSTLDVPAADKAAERPSPVGKTLAEWLVELLNWANQTKVTLDTAKKTCDDTTDAYQEEVSECEEIHRQLDDKREVCNTKQVTLDVATCTYVSEVMSSCEGSVSCYTQAKQAWDDQLPAIQEAEGNRNKEWWMMKRIGCYLDVFVHAATAGAVDNAKLEECKNKQHGSLALDYKPLPEEPDACVEPPKPCVDDYVQQAYQGLPSNAPAKDCTPCGGGSGGGGSAGGGSSHASTVASALGESHSQCAFQASGVCHNARPSSFDAGGYTNVFIKSGGEVWVNGAHAVRFSTEGASTTPSGAAKPLKLPIDNAVKVCIASNAIRILKADGTLWGMGMNNNNQLGFEGSGSWDLTPTQMPGVTDVVDVQCGNTHTIFMKKDNSVWGVGGNGRGQLCIGNTATQKSPVQITGVNGNAGSAPYTTSTGCTSTTNCWPTDGPLAILATGDGTLFMRRDGVLLGCGNAPSIGGSSPRESTHPAHENWSRQPQPADVVSTMQFGMDVKDTWYLRNGEVRTSPYWNQAVVTDVAKMWVGDQAAWFIKKDGTVWGRSQEQYYYLGFGVARINTYNPLELKIPANRPDLIAPSTCKYFLTGARHSVCVADDGKVYTTGCNGYWVLGTNRATGNVGHDGEVQAFIPQRCNSPKTCTCFLGYSAMKEPYWIPMDADGPPENTGAASWLNKDTSVNPNSCDLGPTGPAFSLVA